MTVSRPSGSTAPGPVDPAPMERRPQGRGEFSDCSAVPSPSTILIASDLPQPLVTRSLRSGEWVRLRRGAYLPADAVPPLTSRDPGDGRALHLARIAAVAAQARGPVTFSHDSAALIWGASLWRTPAQVHLTQRSSPSSRRAADIARHRRALGPEEIVARAGVLVTSPIRTLVDCVTTMPALSGLVTADSFLASGLDRLTVVAALEARGRCNGARTARLVIAASDGGAESPGESFLRFVVWAHGLPRPETQVHVVTHLGDFWADLGWRRWRVLLEYDGLGKYRDHPDGAPFDVVIREKRRQDAIQEAGFRIVRVTKFDLRRPEMVIRRILALLPHQVASDLSPIRELLLPAATR